MKKYLLKYGWAFYLGAALGHFYGSHSWSDWRFYAVVVPVAFLVVVREDVILKEKSE